ncbi:MAG: head GIN domain-containing protein [Chloroflexota bacterium]
MKMKLVLLACIFSLTAAVGGCMNGFHGIPCKEGSGTIKKVKLEVSNFQNITLDGAYGVFIRQDSVRGIILETDDNIVEHIKLESMGESIRIKTKGAICPTKINLYISSPNLTGITVNGSADVNGIGKIDFKYFDISINGSGDVRFEDLTTQTLKARVAGSGDLFFGGVAYNSEFEIDGSGDIHADKLRSSYCDATIAGSGDMAVWADSSLRAAIHGAGDILYYGAPRSIKTTVHGSGEITQGKR